MATKFGIALDENEWGAILQQLSDYIEKRKKAEWHFKLHGSTCPEETAHYEIKNLLKKLKSKE